MARPIAPLPDRDSYLELWSVGHGGYDPRSSFWAFRWLTLTYWCARPLAAAGVTPNQLTVAGTLASGGVAGLASLAGRWPLAAVVVVIGSGLIDNLDGCVALLTATSSRLGYVLDSLGDRLSDTAYVTALWLLGGPAWLAVVVGAATALQEYARARAGNAGMAEIGVATVWERPTRVIVVAWTLLACGALPGHIAVLATSGLVASAALSAIAALQLGRAVRLALR